MRTDVELLQIMLDALNNRKGRTGLCALITDLDFDRAITHDEAYNLQGILYANKPSEHIPRFSHFTKDEVWNGGSYWWRCIEDDSRGLEVRIQFITELIQYYNDRATISD